MAGKNFIIPRKLRNRLPDLIWTKIVILCLYSWGEGGRHKSLDLKWKKKVILCNLLPLGGRGRDTQITGPDCRGRRTTGL